LVCGDSFACLNEQQDHHEPNCGANGNHCNAWSTSSTKIPLNLEVSVYDASRALIIDPVFNKVLAIKSTLASAFVDAKFPDIIPCRNLRNAAKIKEIKSVQLWYLCFWS